MSHVMPYLPSIGTVMVTIMKMNILAKSYSAKPLAWRRLMRSDEEKTSTILLHSFPMQISTNCVCTHR